MRATALTTIASIVEDDEKVIFIGSDLGSGTLQELRQSRPKQFFMEGISEQYVVGLAAGLAREGFIPYVNTIANFFTRRALEQIIVDAGFHSLPVRFLANGGGMVYSVLGATHTAVDDFALLSSTPNIRILAPSDANEMRNLIENTVQHSGPMYFRIAKGGEELVTEPRDKEPWRPKIWESPADEVLIITTGIILQEALACSISLKKLGIFCSVLHFSDLTEIKNYAFSRFYHYKLWVIAEEHQEFGGLFSRVLHSICPHFHSNMRHLHLDASYIHHFGSQIDHLRKGNLNREEMLIQIKDWYEAPSSTNK